MKTTPFLTALIFATATSWLGAAKPAECDLYIKNQDVAEPGYLVKLDAKGYSFSANPSGANPRLYPSNLIERVAFKEPLAWREGQKLWAKGDYVRAEKEFGKVVEDYNQLEAVPGNYSTPSRLKQLECLRKTGNYKALADKRFSMKREGMGEALARQSDIYQGWAYLADIKAPKAAEQLDLLIKPHRNKPYDLGQMAQIAYLSGVAHQQLNRPAEALTDYHRAFTLNYASDQELAKLAMGAALQLYAADPKLDEKYQLLKEAHGLAVIYQGLFGKVPSGTERFTKPVPPPPPGTYADEETETSDKKAKK